LEAVESLESASTLASTAFQPIEPRLGREGALAERFYLPELDVLRFFAFLSVFITHVAFFSLSRGAGGAGLAGSFGVDLFFALSSYLITRLLLRERDLTGQLGIRAFYLRRILRIWPLYFFYLALAFCVSRLAQAHGDRLLVNTAGTLSFGYLFAFLFLSGNLAITFWGELGLMLNPLWSLCVEEQFYLLWPQIVGRVRRSAIAPIAVAMLLVAAGARALAASLGYHGGPVFFFTLTRLDPIAAGILLAMVPQSFCANLGRAPRIALVVLGAVCWGLAAGVWKVTAPTATGLDMGLGYPAVALGSAAFLAATLGAGNPDSRFFLKRWLVYLGKISYGLYVYHGFFIVMSRDLIYHLVIGWPARFGGPFPLGLAFVLYVLCSLSFTVIVAACSYRWLEAPFLRLKRRFTVVVSRPV
jgi:peptidoglycan/LPS O-acetylase OafA/YrhL